MLPKSAQQHLLESLLPPGLKEAIEAAKTQIPAFANAVNQRVASIEQNMAYVVRALDRIEASLSNLHLKVAPDSPPVETALTRYLATGDTSEYDGNGNGSSGDAPGAD